jgi:hypothetical protein
MSPYFLLTSLIPMGIILVIGYYLWKKERGRIANNSANQPQPSQKKLPRTSAITEEYLKLTGGH